MESPAYTVRQEFLNVTNKKIKLLQRAKDATWSNTLPRHTSQNIRNEFIFKVSVQKPKTLIPNFILKFLQFGIISNKDPEKER